MCRWKTAVRQRVMAHNFYGQPSEKLKLVGVTTSKWKTTIATLLFKLFSALGYKMRIINHRTKCIGSRIIKPTHPTPDAVKQKCDDQKRNMMKAVHICTYGNKFARNSSAQDYARVTVSRGDIQQY